MKKILIVDDEPNITIAIRFLLEQEGYQTEVVHDGLQAIAQAKIFMPDLIVLDVMMPHMSGFEVAETLLNDPAYRDTHILFLTAKGADRDKSTGYGVGGDTYLVKPFDNDNLKATIHDILDS